MTLQRYAAESWSFQEGGAQAELGNRRKLMGTKSHAVTILWNVRSRWVGIRTIIEKYKIDGFWHLTDLANIESIKMQHGLLSTYRKKKDLEKPGT